MLEKSNVGMVEGWTSCEIELRYYWMIVWLE